MNLLKSASERHDIEVEIKENSMEKAIEALMLLMRKKVMANKTRMILQMEPVSFELHTKGEAASTGSGSLIGALTKGKDKFTFSATIGIEIKYIEL